MNRRAFLRQCGTGAFLTATGALAQGCLPRRRETLERDAQGRLVLRFWNGFTGPDGKTMERIVRRFQDDHPDLRVKMQIIPWGTYYDKLTLALAYGGAPDVFIMHAGRLPEYAFYEALRPLDAEITADQTILNADRFAPIPWKATFWENQQFGLPLDVHPIGLYYNTALFEKAGIVDGQGRAKPPTTGAEFLDAAKALTRDTDNDGRPDQWGFVFTWQRTNFITFAEQFGGGILTADNARSALDSPGTHEAVEWMRSLIYTHHVTPKPEGVDAWLAFRQGRVGMAMEGIYMLSSLDEQKGLAFAGAPVPLFGSRKAAWAGSHLLCMPRTLSADAAGAAWKFMRYLSEHSVAWAAGGQVPARVDLLRSPEFTQMPVQAAFAKQRDYVRYDPLIPRSAALFPFVDPAIEAALLNLEDPVRVFERASRQVQQVLDKP